MGYKYGEHEPTQNCPYCKTVCAADFVDIGVGFNRRREMMGHYADFYLEAVVSGRAEQWKKAVICYIELVGKNEKIERREKK